MALWLLRGGKYGEHEQKFFTDGRIYLTWDELNADLSTAKDYGEIKDIMRQTYPAAPERRLGNWTGQVWAFALPMKEGDLVIVPRKTTPAMAVGEVTSPYGFDGTAPSSYQHFRTVKWLSIDIPRSAFDQDLLYSFGAVMTICQIRRNDAEARVRSLVANGFKAIPAVQGVTTSRVPQSADEDVGVDLDIVARDQIARLLIRKYKGHGMARVVDAILRAQGYHTFVSPEGPDKGVDILAAPGPMGFGEPRLCVQVKSGDAPVDFATLNQLIGTMQNVHASQGLLVSWGGFKSTIDRETANMFFRVRLWDQDDLINALLEEYDKLDADFRADLPLKRIWIVAAEAAEPGE
jgi:restriction system protein